MQHTRTQITLQEAFRAIAVARPFKESLCRTPTGHHEASLPQWGQGGTGSCAPRGRTGRFVSWSGMGVGHVAVLRHLDREGADEDPARGKGERLYHKQHLQGIRW